MSWLPAMGRMTGITTGPCLCVWHLEDLEALSKFTALQQQQWKLAAIWNYPHLTDKKIKFQRGKMTWSSARTQPQAPEIGHCSHPPSPPSTGAEVGVDPAGWRPGN